MAAAYSMDVRERVIKDAEAGNPDEGLGGAVSRQHRVGGSAEAAQAGNGVDRAETPDEVSPSRVGGLSGPAQSVGYGGPGRDLEELRESLQTSAGLTTIWRELNNLELTVKKNRHVASRHPRQHESGSV